MLSAQDGEQKKFDLSTIFPWFNYKMFNRPISRTSDTEEANLFYQIYEYGMFFRNARAVVFSGVKGELGIHYIPILQINNVSQVEYVIDQIQKSAKLIAENNATNKNQKLSSFLILMAIFIDCLSDLSYRNILAYEVFQFRAKLGGVDLSKQDNAANIRSEIKKQFRLTDNDQIDFIDRYRGQAHDEFLDRLELYFCFPEIYLSTLFDDTDGTLKEIFMFQSTLVDGINQLIDPAKLFIGRINTIIHQNFSSAALHFIPKTHIVESFGVLHPSSMPLTTP